MHDFVCDTCGRELPENRFNLTCGSPETCFGCRAKTISTSFAGGKAQFHNHTTSEMQNATVTAAKRNGLDPVPVWTKPNFGGTTGHTDRLAKALEKREAGNAA